MGSNQSITYFPLYRFFVCLTNENVCLGAVNALSECQSLVIEYSFSVTWTFGEAMCKTFFHGTSDIGWHCTWSLKLFVMSCIILSCIWFRQTTNWKINTSFCCFQNAGSFYEWVGAGLTSVKIKGFNNGTVDLSHFNWIYKVFFFVNIDCACLSDKRNNNVCFNIRFFPLVKSAKLSPFPLLWFKVN